MSDTIIKNGDKTHKDRVERATKNTQVIANRAVRVKTISKKPIVHKVEVSNGTIPGRFLETVKKYPDKTALMYKKGHLFEEVTYKRLLNLVQNFTLSLEKFGVKKGDRVVLISENRPEWAVCDLAVKSLGAILAPMHKSFTATQITELVKQVDPSFFIVSDTATLFKIMQVKKRTHQKTPVIFFDENEKNSNESCEDGCDFICALKKVPHNEFGVQYERQLGTIKPNEVASILFTPDDSGKYNGVQLTHRNIVSNANSTIDVLKFNKDDSFMSVLPLAHSLEKTVGFYIPIFVGARIGYLNNMTEFTKMAKAFKPTIILAVPRIFEKTYQRTLTNINESKLREHIISSCSCKEKYKGSILNRAKEIIVYKRVRKSLGGNIRLLISGGAALGEDTSRFYSNAGVPILEGYGLTESSPVVSVNRIGKNKIGTVGMPLPDVEVRIAYDSEVLIKGPNVTQGYINQSPLNGDGWFHTGDYGEIDEDGYLKLTGKKKDIIVLSTGKNISPAAIEVRLSESKYIKDSLVVGDGQKNIGAIIFINQNEIKNMFPYLKDNQIQNNDDVKHFIKAEIDDLQVDLSHYEKVNKFILLKDLSQEIFGLRRQEALEEFSNEISLIYKESKNISGLE